VTIDGVQTVVGGDVIVSFDETPVASFEDLVAAIGQAVPDQEVTLTILRDSESQTVTITLGARPGALPE
jgi:S1-C subfamily serine protease